MLINRMVGYTTKATIKQGNSGSEVTICFVLNLSYQQILQLLQVIMLLGFTLCHCHKLLVE